MDKLMLELVLFEPGPLQLHERPGLANLHNLCLLVVFGLWTPKMVSNEHLNIWTLEHLNIWFERLNIWTASFNQHINHYWSTFLIDLATKYTGINAPNFWGAWGGYREILRSVRRLCEKVVRGRLQELLSELIKADNQKINPCTASLAAVTMQLFLKDILTIWAVFFCFCFWTAFTKEVEIYRRYIGPGCTRSALARQLIWKGILIYRRYIGAGCTRSALARHLIF